MYYLDVPKSNSSTPSWISDMESRLKKCYQLQTTLDFLDEKKSIKTYLIPLVVFIPPNSFIQPNVKKLGTWDR